MTAQLGSTHPAQHCEVAKALAYAADARKKSDGAPQQPPRLAVGPEAGPGSKSELRADALAALMLSLGVGLMALPNEISNTGTVPYAILFVCVVSE